MLTRSCPLFFALVVATVGCNQAPRGQWVWDVGDQGAYRPSPQLQGKLQRRADFELTEERLDRVFEKWHENFDVNFHLNWAALEAAAIDRDLEVTLRLRDVTLATAMKRLLIEVAGDETELGYQVTGNVVLVSTLEDLSRHTMIRIYDVTDLVRFDWSTVSGNDLGGSTGCFPATQPINVRQKVVPRELRGTIALSEIIWQIVSPESWRETGGNLGNIHDYGPFLIIIQTPVAHQEIEDLIQALRKAVAD